jgi:hypothetical protein
MSPSQSVPYFILDDGFPLNFRISIDPTLSACWLKTLHLLLNCNGNNCMLRFFPWDLHLFHVLAPIHSQSGLPLQIVSFDFVFLDI